MGFQGSTVWLDCEKIFQMGVDKGKSGKSFMKILSS